MLTVLKGNRFLKGTTCLSQYESLPGETNFTNRVASAGVKFVVLENYYLRNKAAWHSRATATA